MATADRVVIKHVFKAKPEVIFKAWTTPELMRRWMDGGAPPIDIPHTSADLRIGGRYEVVMQGKLLHHGEYREIDPPRRLVFTWNSPFVRDTLVTLEFRPQGPHTEMTLIHELLPADQVAGHTKGWTTAIGNLDHIFEQGGLS